MMRPYLQFDQLTYYIGSRAVLDQVSGGFEIGQLIALIGPNGAGKTTLLRAISGEIVPQKGTIWLNNRRLPDWDGALLAKHRAVLSQMTHLSMGFSVEEVVMMGRYPHFNGQPTPTDRQAAAAAMQETRVQPFAQREYPSLSGGEQQRVGVAKALAQVWEGRDRLAPKLLLLDEPLNNLDIEHQHGVMEQARHFAQQATW